MGLEYGTKQAAIGYLTVVTTVALVTQLFPKRELPHLSEGHKSLRLTPEQLALKYGNKTFHNLLHTVYKIRFIIMNII